MEKRSYNLCSTYVLPLLGLNKFSFGSTTDSFVNSYITEDQVYTVVQLKKPVSTVIQNHSNFRFKFEREGYFYAVFEIPQFYKEDIKRFVEGRYSEFSNPAKEQIRKRSGLNYRVPIPGGGMRSARELLALDRDEALRRELEKELAVRIDPKAELASIPGPENFLDLKLSTSLEPLTT